MSDKQGAPILPPLNRGAANNGGAAQQTVSLQQVLATQGLNVLSTSSGQQFVITSQVPGLTQVIPNNITTNASGTQQVGVTRIVNIAGTPPRNTAGLVAGNVSVAGTSPVASRPQNSTKVVLATSPKLVRTSLSNMFATPMSSQTSSPQTRVQSPSPPARKRLKLSETTEKAVAFDSSGYRRRILEHKIRRMRIVREKYVENVSELFFLHIGGNMMDYPSWQKRPPTPQYLHFLRQHPLDPDDDDEDLTAPLSSDFSQLSTVTTVATATVAAVITTAAVTATVATVTTGSTMVQIPNQSAEVKISGAGVTPVALSTTLPAAALAQLTQQGQVPGRPQGGRHGMVFAFRAAIQSSPSVTVHPPSASTLAPTLIIGGTPVVTEPSKPAITITAPSPVIEKPSSSITTTVTPKTPTTTTALNNPQPVVKLVKLSTPTTIVTSCDITNNQEQIVEKAKQEAYVMQRIAELQREGLWSERRLPKVQEPARTKAHWDYLLEEMVWLAADFAQERKWKKAAAKKCARMVQKYFQEKAIQAQKAEKSQELRLKKIASFVAKEIKTFWTNVEKLVEYKQQTRLEEKRKKALDQHLNFIVGQTEKYSTWLTEGLNKTDGSQSIPASINSSRISSPVPQGKCHSDEEFQPNQSSDDDEETIAKAEEEMKLTTNHKEEVELLKRESEIPLEDLLKDLPPDYLEDCNKSLSPHNATNEEEQNDNKEAADADADFVAASGESSDEEDTIMEEEKLEGEIDHKRELDELKADNEMSIEELAAKYANMSDMDVDVDVEVEGTDKENSDKEVAPETEDQTTSSENESEESDRESDEEEVRTQSDAEADVGLQSLLEDPSEKQLDRISDDHSDARNEMDNVAALAESIQPKGNTLLTTSVVTKIPFLLKHSLREYQHIGLDWLVTMYDRKLNGILADEMGLGKTIQTIALLAHLACEKGNWGPHLIIVPTSVMLNWEMECKKWCPGFKILTYYGTQKERKQKRTGWTKPNAFHICITSYKLVIQDHQSFRRKKWKYLILDEAQNIKNFKSQRWQLLLNFQTQRRLLLTGTPLQNNLMELWSLMHFLMPNVFQSHREFKEWFSNPVTGMIEGNSEYNENIIRRLHKVLRPFLLRRLKTEVEKQLPKKYEHVVMCRLSKRQRFLYDDFMSRAKTKETLASGNLLSVINVLMQLRKVCNHPNLFEVRPTVSPFQMEAIEFLTASLVWSVFDYDPFKHIQLSSLNLLLLDLELTLSAFVAHRMKRLQTPRKLIEEIDNQPEPTPRCPSGRIKINVRLSNQAKPQSSNTQQQHQQQQTPTRLKNLAGVLPTPRMGTSLSIKSLNTSQTGSGRGVTLRVASGQQLQGYSVQLVPHQAGVKAIPVATLGHNPQNATVTSTTTGTNAQRFTVGNASLRDGIQRLTTQTVTVKQGDSVQRIAVPGFAQLVQTSTGRHILLTSNQQNTNTVSFPVMTSSGSRLTVLSKSLMGLSTSAATVNKVVGGVVTTPSGRPVMRVPPLNVTASQSPSGNSQQQSSQQQSPSIRSIVTRQAQKETSKAQSKSEQPKSEFHLPQLEEERRQRRQAKLCFTADINQRRCAACPLYGEDVFMALRIGKPTTACRWHNGWVHCTTAKENIRTRKQFFSRTEALAEAIKSTEQIVEELKEVFERFVVHVPAVRAPTPRFHVSHPPPHKLWAERQLRIELQKQLSPKLAVFHPISSLMLTQFPDPRLIQYDCGKLQSLDRLLRKLKSENHRVLIFTQMTRMLDVLEAFLNFHGHIYLRLDGTTRVDQRQILMERFNGDKRIFCFILSTRSGGVGVNLTGADTVIFYDSDWNPTMDAQAQDRCHRIGQTRDVHIYRLVSEKTVEENILKKANQKRLLGDLAIEGGNFTTAYFKSSTIQDLFNIDQTENDASMRMAEVLEQNREREKAWNKEPAAGSFQGISNQHTEEKAAMGALENALAAAEEDLDVQAAKTAKAEAVADLAEFDENIPLEDADKDETQVSKAEQEVQNLVAQLTPIERYAMRFVEESEGAFSAAQLAAAERELEQQKKEWELDRLRALREEEERRMRLADDDEKPLTFGREDAQNQVNSTAAKSGGSKRLISKRLAAPSRRSSRRRGGRVGCARLESSSESENETTSTESDSESQEEDIVEDSLDEESSHTESQSQGDEEEEGEGRGEREEEEDDEEEKAGEESEDGKANDRDYSERGGGFSRRKGRLAGSGSCSRNHFDLNSPRTRSRGNVQINLWTLDVSPILPGVKPNCRRQRKKFRIKSEETLFSPSSDTYPKRNVRINMNAKIQSTNSYQNAKISEVTEIERDLTKNNTDSNDSNSVEQQVANPNVKQSADDHVDSMPVAKTQSEQTRIVESNSDNKEGVIKEKNDEKIVNGTNLITVCSVQVTRCSQKMLSATYRKFESEVNRNEDAENLDVNVSARNSRSSPSAIQPDASLKRSKEPTAKSKSEFGVSANSLCNNARGKLTGIAATSRDSGNIESSSIRSVPLLRSKTLRNASPDAIDKVSKPLAISRVSIAQRNSKTNADDTRSNMVENEDKDGTCDNDNDNVESILSPTRKYTSQRHNSKSDVHENLSLNIASLQVLEKGTDDTVSNGSDSLIAPSVKSETNLNEFKYKIRKLEVTIPRSVITRSSKTPSVINNHFEENNTRLTDGKVDSLFETKSGLQTKTSQGTRKIDLTNSQHSVTEQSRITRSIAPPLTPPPLVSDDETTNSKLALRRRPDTPLPRPITRSAVIVNTSLRVSPSRSEKYVTRNSKHCQDNGLVSPVLLRCSSSISPMKPDSKETSVTAIKRRPDTPRPNIPPNYNEQISRVTRSGLTLNSSVSSAKSASSSLFSPPSSALKTSVKQSRTSPTNSEHETSTSLISSSHEKPQRTAKVVAILSLDTRNHHNSNKTFSSIQTKSPANCETKDKELLVPRLLLRDQETDREECDSSDTKSRRLRRETKRTRNAASCSLEDERGNSDDSSDREPKRSFRSHLSPSSSSSSTITSTRSDKLRNATIS
ncbi:helicase domino isoform X1 [Cataglyphis hispanica]|uniref:helicase domino isoform X1 n=1 Tax=Cataglyphis hispanica TaxID=1086592 RepID=UPI00217F3EC0|nr:helicase domino isoform X1 [Cataglyphis hispanica]XP_050451372.1 helicase domino isoform X1 [Cataglyphis hispanica]